MICEVGHSSSLLFSFSILFFIHSFTLAASPFGSFEETSTPTPSQNESELEVDEFECYGDPLDLSEVLMTHGSVSTEFQNSLGDFSFSTFGTFNSDDLESTGDFDGSSPDVLEAVTLF